MSASLHLPQAPGSPKGARLDRKRAAQPRAGPFNCGAPGRARHLKKKGVSETIANPLDFLEAASGFEPLYNGFAVRDFRFLLNVTELQRDSLLLDRTRVYPAFQLL